MKNRHRETVQRIPLLAKVKKEYATSGFLLYFLIGVTSALVNFASRFFFEIWFSYILAVGLATVLSNLLNFLLNRRFTFRGTKENPGIQLVKFIINSLGGAVLTAVVAWGIVAVGLVSEMDGLFSIYKSGAHLFSIAVVALTYGYFVTKYFVFGGRTSP